MDTATLRPRLARKTVTLSADDRALLARIIDASSYRTFADHAGVSDASVRRMVAGRPVTASIGRLVMLGMRTLPTPTPTAAPARSAA